MRQLPTDKYNVAWFKLAEFIERGEKERALALYRLLVHSFDDSALACQLEADILGAFDDKNAIKVYEQAAALYKKGGKTLQAAAVYEHLITLCPDVVWYRKEALTHYKQLGQKTRLAHHLHDLITLLFEKNNTQAIQEVYTDFVHDCVPKDKAAIAQSVALEFCKNTMLAKEFVLGYIEKALDILINCEGNELHKFLTTLKEFNKQYYDEACAMINTVES